MRTFSRRFFLSSAVAYGAALAAGRAFANEQAANTSGLIFSPGPPGWWDTERVSSPRVIRESASSWKMWYYGRDESFDPLIQLPTGRVGLAVSRDGISWERVAGPGRMGSVLEPSADNQAFDSGHVGVSSVDRENGQYVMWYFGGDRTEQPTGRPKGFPLRIGRAQSEDGINWVKTRGPFKGAVLDVGGADSVDGAFVGWPHVLRDGDLYRMYYHTFNPAMGFVVCLATSKDGISWEKVGPVLGKGAAGDFDAGGCASRHVIKHGNRFLMFYEGNAGGMDFGGIGVAESADGATFTRIRGPHPNGAILVRSKPGSGAWDAGAVGTPWVVPMPDGSFRMYFVGASEAISSRPASISTSGIVNRIGLAVSKGSDITSWRRWSV